jgi:hypothetical protein
LSLLANTTKCPEQRIDLAPLWTEVRDELAFKDAYKLNVFSVLGHLRSLDAQHTFAKVDGEQMVVAVSEVQ